ncbi:MAG: HEAT repeat domain-containing protein [Armatimonadia bacterium]
MSPRLPRLMLLAVAIVLVPTGAATSAEEPVPLEPPAATDVNHGAELNHLANQPWRPEWAPIPVFRGETTALQALHSLLSSDDPAFRARAAFLLGQIGCPASVSHLTKALGDPVRTVRVQAGIALACLGDGTGIPTCAAVLKAPDPQVVRYYAVYGLWCARSPLARAALQGAANGQPPLVASALKGALTGPERPPITPVAAPGAAPTGPEPPASQIWEQAADVFTLESDWWFHEGDYDQCIRCNEAAILLDPHLVEAYNVAAWLQWSRGRNEESMETLSKCVAANPEDPEAHYNLGYHLFNLKRYGQAEAPLRRSVELGGDNLCRRAYAHCLEREGKLAECLKVWEGLVADRPDDLSARTNRDRVKALVEAPVGETPAPAPH